MGYGNFDCTVCQGEGVVFDEFMGEKRKIATCRVGEEKKQFFKRTGNGCCHLTEGKIYEGFSDCGNYYFTVKMDNGEWSSPHYGGFELIETQKGERAK
jgi:hypothetical protein